MALDTLQREAIGDVPNPLGLAGIEFIEYATSRPQALGQVLEMMGFRPVARHRSREVLLYRQGGMNVVINAHAVLRLGAGSLALVDTDGARARALADRLNALYGPGRVTAGTDATTVVPDATGLIHATPTGMAKLPGLPLDAALLRADLWVSEVVYFPLETALLQAARALGCPISDGGGMAVGQALGAFELFTGCEADPARVERHFHHLLNLRESR